MKTHMGDSPLPNNPQRALSAVLVAQFLSALADNALLFVAIALVRQQHRPVEWVPLLQEFFVLAFVLLAPFAGPFADALPKGRVMILSNGLKLSGAVAMISGVHPLLAYGMVGAGAAAYSPAKYGILSELVTAERLVKANSLMEGSTIVAILLGVGSGGWLADQSVPLGLWSVAGCYFAAMSANLSIPTLSAVHPGIRFQPWEMVVDFLHATLDNPVHHADILRKSAARGLIAGRDADLLVDRALGVELVPAIEAFPARDVMEDDDTIADGKSAHARARGCHDASRLVAKNARRRKQIVFDLLEIGVADTAAFHADEELARPDGGRRHLLHRYPAFAGVDRGPHHIGHGNWRSC